MSNLQSKKIQKQVQKLQKDVRNPPKDDSQHLGIWIKQQAQQVKSLLQVLLHNPEGIQRRFEFLDQLSSIRQELSDMNRNLKTGRGRKAAASKESLNSRKQFNTESLSKKSKDSTLRTHSVSVKSLKKAKSKSKSKSSSKQQPDQSKKKKLDPNTPRFFKKMFSTRLGSFAKPLQKLTQSSKRSVRSSRSKSKSPSSVSKSRSISKSRVSSNTPSSTRKLQKNKKSLQKAKQSPKPVKKQVKKPLKKMVNHSSSSSSSESSQKYRSLKMPNMQQDSGNSSSLSLSQDLKDAVKLKIGKLEPTKFDTFAPTKERFKAMATVDQKVADIDAGQLTREENLLLTTKLEQVTKERLLREYRILYYRNKEVRKLLQEFHDQNASLTEQVEENKIAMSELYDHYKNSKKSLKQSQKEMKVLKEEYMMQTKELKQTMQSHDKEAQKAYQNAEMYSEFKQDNERLAMEVAMLREANEMQQLKIQELEHQLHKFDEIRVMKDHQLNEQLDERTLHQENYMRFQREIENLKEQLERSREDYVRNKLLLEKEQLQNREMASQLGNRRSDQDDILEQKQYEIGQLKQLLQGTNLKCNQLENQLSQLKFQNTQEQEQIFDLKDRMIRMEEEQRIALMKIENREKEIQEFKQKELGYKKRMIEMEARVEPVKYEQQELNYKSNFESKLTNINKDLQNERVLSQRLQSEMLTMQSLNDKLQRDLRNVQSELQSESHQNSIFKSRLAQVEQKYASDMERFKGASEAEENNKLRELVNAEQVCRNQEMVIQQQGRKIEELQQKEKDLYELQQKVKGLLEMNQELDARSSQLQDEVKEMRRERDELIEVNRRQEEKIYSLSGEVEQMDRMKDNYKNKYLHSKYETKKLMNEQSEKENMMKSNYSSELERIKSEKESLQKMKSQEDQNRKQKDKKLKVFELKGGLYYMISELQEMIKGHKQQIFEK